MNQNLFRQVNDYIEFNGFVRVGIAPGPLGDIYVAEKKTDVGWEVLWATRDPLNEVLPEGKRRAMMRTIHMTDASTPAGRQAVAIESAEEAQRDNARFIGIMNLKEFDATSQ